MKYFREKTGMYIDWDQLDRLPQIDTLIDIGVGPMGTPELYSRFKSADLILIDPLKETENYVKEKLRDRRVSFFQCGVGDASGTVTINVEQEIGRSSVLQASKINYEGPPVDRRIIKIEPLDKLLSSTDDLGEIGIKIDTEGYELKVIQGAEEVLKQTRWVLAEVRHNHESFDGVYRLHQFVNEMQSKGFILSMIITAKPFIADLCFEHVSKLDF